MLRVRWWVAVLAAPFTTGCFAADPAESRVAMDDAEVARAADVGAGPATAPPQIERRADAAIPDAETPDAVRPDSNVTDAALPNAAIPDAALPDAGVPGVALPDLALPDAIAPDAAPPDAAPPDAALPDASPLDWTCPPLDCERDIPDAPEGAPMVCNALDIGLECHLSMPTCDLGDCQHCDIECLPGFMAGSPGDRLEGCFDCPVVEVVPAAGGESTFLCEGREGNRWPARPFRWCRFDPQGRVVEKQTNESRFGVTYAYDEQGRVVSARASLIEASGSPLERGETCRYDDAGRVVARRTWDLEFDDAAFSDNLAECVRYDASGRVLGYESASFRVGDVYAERCLLSAPPGRCSTCEYPDGSAAGAACEDELAGIFPF